MSSIGPTTDYPSEAIKPYTPYELKDRGTPGSTSGTPQEPAPSTTPQTNTPNPAATSLPGASGSPPVTGNLPPPSPALPTGDVSPAAAYDQAQADKFNPSTHSGALNVNNPEHRAFLESMGITDGQLNNRNTDFGILKDDEKKVLAYQSKNSETGDERFGFIPLNDAKSVNAGAEGWKSHKNEAENQAMKSTLDGIHASKETAQAAFGDDRETYNASEKMAAQVRALSSLDPNGEEIKNLTKELASLKDPKLSDKAVKMGDLQGRFDKLLSDNESYSAYLAGRQLASGDEIKSDAVKKLTDDLDSTVQDLAHNGEDDSADSAQHLAMMSDHETQLDDATSALHNKGFESDKQKAAHDEELTDLSAKVDQLKGSGSLSPEALKKIEVLTSSLTRNSAQEDRHRAYEASEMEYINSLMKEATDSSSSKPSVSNGDKVNATIDGNEVQLSQVRETGGDYNDVYSREGSDTLYQKDREGYKAIEKSDDGLYHVPRFNSKESKQEAVEIAEKLRKELKGDWETLYGDGPLGIKQVVAGYKAGESPSESTPDRYYYHYAHEAQASLVREHGSYDAHMKDDKLIGFVQRSANGKYVPFKE